MNETNSWGYHLLSDCAAGDRNKVTDPANIRAFVDHLVETIDMKAYGALSLDHFATHDPEKAGYSFCQMIETSNISGHFVDKNGDFYIDVFSCKSFEIEPVRAAIERFFGPKSIKFHFISRKA